MANCEHGCCELLDSFDGTQYSVCAECGNDDGHECGRACSFCGDLPEAARSAREQAETRSNARPRSAYLKRLDTGKVIETEEEYKKCVADHVPLAQITLNQAVDTVFQQRAAIKKIEKRHKHNKVARKQARQNRKKK